MAPLLELDHVAKSFGALRVIENLSLRLDEGDALGVVGPNGAGKTTMLGLIAGSTRPTAGRVLFQGRDLTRTPSHQRCQAGIARTHQVPRPFGDMTVLENVLVGATYGRHPAQQGQHHTRLEECAAVLEQTGLLARADALAGSLTLLQRKRLELARALATHPRLLLLDEIAGGLTDAEVHELVETIQQIRGSGVTIIWIEHIVRALQSVVTRLLAIDFGRVLLEGPPDEVMRSPEVQRVYLGIGAEEAVA